MSDIPTFTVWNQRTSEVFGRGLTVQDAYDVYCSKAIEVDDDAVAVDDPGSDLMMLKTNRSIAAGTDEAYAYWLQEQRKAVVEA